ncbi:MAG: S46 family peptidase [Acidobacteriota bacterium]
MVDGQGCCPGKWTPEQLLELDPARLCALGLELDPRSLWNPDEGGLLEAVVQLNEASAGFVSEEGLILTNQHCAFDVLQEHSSSDQNLIAEGFLAASRSDELVGTATRATVPHRFLDVTAEIEEAARGAADDYARYQAIDRKKKELVAASETSGSRRCRVVVYDDGVRYVLVEALEFRDVRLVYAPPRGVGEYGGNVDTWTWPRHTGDFALLRVYADSANLPAPPAAENRPYRPRRHLDVAQSGVRDGDFVMVAGYPGVTYRSRLAEEMAARTEDDLPRRVRLYSEWRDILGASSAEDEEAALRLAGRLKRLIGAEKNLRGKVRGIARGDMLRRKRELEGQVLAWVAENEEHRAAAAAHEELSAGIRDERRMHGEGDLLLQQLFHGPQDLMAAVRLTRWAQEREKPDAERRERYQERHREMLWRSEVYAQKRLHPPTERRLLEDLLRRMRDAGISAVLSLLRGRDPADAVRGAVDHLLDGTRIHDLSERLKMFDESVEELRARCDPLVDFAFGLNQDLLDMVRRHDAWVGAVSRLRPVWRRALQAYLGQPLAPDANGTLRVSLAHVRGYRPRDGVWMEPRTRLAGVLEKHTGEEPFDAPDLVRAGAPEAPRSRWADPELGDVPVCFLATGDTTKGNSGSPVLNGRGELVGVNFSRVWENVANDFGYDPEVSRNVCVDVRYLLWLVEKTPGSAALLAELGVGGCLKPPRGSLQRPTFSGARS